MRSPHFVVRNYSLSRVNNNFSLKSQGGNCCLQYVIAAILFNLWEIIISYDKYSRRWHCLSLCSSSVCNELLMKYWVEGQTCAWETATDDWKRWLSKDYCVCNCRWWRELWAACSAGRTTLLITKTSPIFLQVSLFLFQNNAVLLSRLMVHVIYTDSSWLSPELLLLPIEWEFTNRIDFRFMIQSNQNSCNLHSYIISIFWDSLVIDL